MSFDMSGVPRASPREAEFFLRKQQLISQHPRRELPCGSSTS